MTKRMVLVDERAYNEMQPNDTLKRMLNDEKWKRTPAETSKTLLSNSLQSQLDSIDIPDDLKAKLYQKTLKRFLSLKQQVPDIQPTAVNGLLDSPKQVAKQVVTKRKRKPAHWPAGVKRVSLRKRIPWSKFDHEWRLL
jgi:hypothetical protein